MSQNVLNNNELYSDEENIDPILKKPKSTSKTFITMASESDSGYSVSATPSAASPAINNSREATDSPCLEDTEAGPDINEDEFRSANDIFKGNIETVLIKNHFITFGRKVCTSYLHI